MASLTGPGKTALLSDPDGAHIAADDNISDDADSSYGSDIESFTTSLTDSVTKYKIEHGRRYHAFKEGSYPFPNDDRESDRLDLAHELSRMLLGGKLHLTTLDKPQKILDIGTGTGIWAVEIADEYPSAQVVGNDLSPIQPTWVPPNLKFVVDDVESEWVDDPYDFIHCRYMVASIGDWPTFVKRIYEHTKPGGKVEFQDYDLLYYSQDDSFTDTNFCKWDRLWVETADKLGREPRPGIKLQGWIEDAGFTNIVHRKFPVPVGIWPKEPGMKKIGAFSYTNVYEGLEAFSLKLFQIGLGWDVEQTQVLLADVRKDMKNSKIHALYDLHVVCAERPLE